MVSDDEPVFLCDCGAEIEALRIMQAGTGRSQWVPGQHVELCRCPPPSRCVSCGHEMANRDPHPACEQIECPLRGVWQLVPR